MLAVGMKRVECVRKLVALEKVDLETRDSRGRGLEKLARIQRSQKAWQLVREELVRRGDTKVAERNY